MRRLKFLLKQINLRFVLDTSLLLMSAFVFWYAYNISQQCTQGTLVLNTLPVPADDVIKADAERHGLHSPISSVTSDIYQYMSPVPAAAIISLQKEAPHAVSRKILYGLD